MLFRAKHHRLTANKWFYLSVPIELSDSREITQRLNDLNGARHLLLSCPDYLYENDVIYLNLRRAGGKGVAEYSEYLIGVRRGAMQHVIAYGNSLIKISSGYGINGHVNLISHQFELHAKCAQELGRIIMDSRNTDHAISWWLTDATNECEIRVGGVIMQRLGVNLDLMLKFPSRMGEDSGKTPKVQILHGDKKLAVATQSLNPIFEKGYRLDRWLKSEVPVLHLCETVQTNDLAWQGILVALVGVICLYTPAKSSGG